MSSVSILIVEDESLVAEEIAMRVKKMGHSVAAIVDNARDAFDYVSTIRPDMALVDINIKGEQNGIAVARRLRTEFDVPVIFLTAHADAATLREAIDTEPFGFIVKPFDARSLTASLETALRRRHAEQQVGKLERWLTSTMTSIGDGVIATDSEFRVAMMNPVAERLSGWSLDAALGRSVIDVFQLADLKGERMSGVIEQAVTSGVAIHLDDRMLIRPDGSQLPIDDTLAPIRDETDRIKGIVIVFRDATARKRHEQQLADLNAVLEDKVIRRTAQLQAANAELATFSYSIAHDLRAPLRAIIGFARCIAEDHSASLDREGRRLLDVVTSSAGQMSKMIDDYLRLSGLSRVGIHRRALNMTQLARDAWTLATNSAAKIPELRLEELPSSFGDESLMRQVWSNLLSNAVKFSRAAAAPCVRISGVERGNQMHYVIADNGAGFNPAYASKLFRVFERLHTQSEFEGSGVGLCIVQRILHRHEGDIAVTGLPGKGTTVEFWLPLRDPDAPKTAAVR